MAMNTITTAIFATFPQVESISNPQDATSRVPASTVGKRELGVDASSGGALADEQPWAHILHRMRAIVGPFAAAAVLWATPAFACLEIVTPKGQARAFKAADLVVSVRALDENYIAVPNTQSLRAGVATAEVVDVMKGRAARGGLISYRVVDGQAGPSSCPARRSTRPGGRYTLYLKHASDWGPPTILLPTD